MLSQKRCRGTLQDYKKGKISKCQSKLWTNRNVFSWCLNQCAEIKIIATMPSPNTHQHKCFICGHAVKNNLLTAVTVT